MLRVDPSSDKPLTTPRLILEPLTVEHAAALYDKYLDPKLYTYIPLDPPGSRQAFLEYLGRLGARTRPDRKEIWLNWTARMQAAPHHYVGYFQATLFENGSAAISYTVFSEYWRRGYGFEGCDRVLEHLFHDYALEKVFVEIDTRNKASIKLIEKLGFVRTATTENADFFKGAPSDEYRYELSALARGNWVLKRIPRARRA